MTEHQQKSPDPDFTLAQEVETFRLSRPEIIAIEVSTVRGTRLRFPEANQAAPSFVPVPAPNGTFRKPHASVPELIEILRKRGLTILDSPMAAAWLEKVGYYRLTGYGLHFRLKDATGGLADSFARGTRFEDLVDLYEFDRHLRLLILDAIERIEVAFRSRFNDLMSSRYGPH